jgi:hypothetical protein
MWIKIPKRVSLVDYDPKQGVPKQLLKHHIVYVQPRYADCEEGVYYCRNREICQDLCAFLAHRNPNCGTACRVMGEVVLLDTESRNRNEPHYDTIYVTVEDENLA